MIKETEVPPTARQSFKALDASTVPQVTENQQSPPALGQGLVHGLRGICSKSERECPLGERKCPLGEREGPLGERSLGRQLLGWAKNYKEPLTVP